MILSLLEVRNWKGSTISGLRFNLKTLKVSLTEVWTLEASRLLSETARWKIAVVEAYKWFCFSWVSSNSAHPNTTLHERHLKFPVKLWIFRMRRRRLNEEILIAMTTDEFLQMQCWLFNVFLANMLIQSAFRCENFLAIVTSNHFAEEHWIRIVDSYNVPVSETYIKTPCRNWVWICTIYWFRTFFKESYIKWREWTVSQLSKLSKFFRVITERPKSASEISEPTKSKSMKLMDCALTSRRSGRLK